MKRTALSLAISSALVAAPTAVLAATESPYLQSDGSWITLSGTVTSTAAETFKLDYGGGLVTVEMDDWDWYEEDGEILSGDKVTVYGEVDDDTFENTKIEASSVYVENLGTYFFASAKDEENFNDLDVTPTVPVDVGDLTITGTVESVDGREFTIDSAAQQMKVDTTFMSYNPMDDEGYQNIDKGDFVTVTGNTEYDTFEKQELMAESVVTLDDDREDSS
ncbi:NirD/YgiW/YdeI family stress tolerance protein [Marinobacter sp. 71-i]|uniref:NirD/YgiW/YdeI family stress tolerance protein n=1 Tax=Marinobacter iranensis TaxID=2962607 RepID=A0ABT5YE77_9GAMM|nr:NirD/YgiW/YdeI family stress tolerance protein [Marinobacter iranensis]MDF0751998.1 NirD/YgiW/YdeI family stress tolerance protein [Marinobacter iranensis]